MQLAVYNYRHYLGIREGDLVVWINGCKMSEEGEQMRVRGTLELSRCRSEEPMRDHRRSSLLSRSRPSSR